MVMGKNEFKYEAFDIRKIIVDQNIFAINTPYMKVSDFRSTLIDALNVGEPELAEHFIDKYFEKLHPQYREDVRNYCRSRISYEKENYDELLQFAGRVNINQITFKLDLKNLIAKIYYDTDSTEPLYSLLNSYYQLINNSDSRNKEYLSRHKNFVRYLRNLAAAKHSQDKQTELAVLKKNIEKENISSKSCLLKKIDILISN